MVILFSHCLQVNILSIQEIVKGRALMVRAEIRGQVFCFINIYSPNQGTERVDFFNCLRAAFGNQDTREHLTVAEDWNCTIDFTLDRNSQEPHLSSITTLSTLLTQFDLVDAWRCKHPSVRQYTWVQVSSHGVRAARLDRIYISKTITSRLAHSLITPVGFTDHHLATMQLVSSPVKRNNSFWHFNVKLLQDRFFCETFKDFWSH